MDHNRYQSVKIVLWVILFANFIVAAIKIGIGFTCKSQSVTADGIHSFADGASNIVALIGIWLASKPRDKQHPYGHEKYEILASLCIGLMLAMMSVRIVSRAFYSFQNPQTIDVNILQTVLMIITIMINGIVAFIEYRRGKKLDSVILVTDSLHTRGDILISCAVLLGVIGIKMGLPVWVDAAMSACVGVVVMLSAVHIIRDCVDILVDSAIVDVNDVRRLLMEIPGVFDVHQVRSRGESGHIFIDLHVIVNPNESAVYIHTLSHKLEEALRDNYGSNTEVNIHIEPNDKFYES